MKTKGSAQFPNSDNHAQESGRIKIDCQKKEQQSNKLSIHFQRRNKRFLGDINFTKLAHFLFARLLFFQ